MRAQGSSNIPSCIVVLSVILRASADCYDIFGTRSNVHRVVDLKFKQVRDTSLSLENNGNLCFTCKANPDWLPKYAILQPRETSNIRRLSLIILYETSGTTTMSVLLIKASHHRYSTKSFIVVFYFMFKRCLYPDIRFAVRQDLLKPPSLLFSAHQWLAEHKIRLHKHFPL